MHPLEDNEKTTKSQTYLDRQVKDLASHIIGAKDGLGNTITKVFASGDEYVIYEVGDLPKIESLKVRIYTKIEDDLTAVRNFQQVKDAFDRIKSVLYKTGADSSFQHRMAAALSRAILGDIEDSKTLFGKIESDANEDYKHKVIGRLCYLAGAFLLTLILSIFAILTYIFRNSELLTHNIEVPIILYVIAFGSLGGFLSISYKTKDVIAQRAISYWMYSVYGAERLVISIIAAIATYILMKSGIIFTSFAEAKNGLYFILSMCFVSGFSETLIPTYMGKLEQNA
ncbi:hypothetical protein [Methylotenera sp. L2L1]|uniref:hypothetical protein n=1 Tax=Methylotenera sp. L2L1 TaxID=1502770 RepID=UPI00056AE441|nr:hypothetical protein [Methylotenera sp. L2L1]